MPDLLSALVPAGTALAGQPVVPDDDDHFGVLPVLGVLASAVPGLVSTLRKGADAASSPQGKKFLKMLEDTAVKRTSRLKFYEAKVRQAKDPEAKKRWQRRFQRQRERVDALRQEAMLARRGIVGEGPVLEYRRNLLALEWDDASPERKGEIESTIQQMDERLKALQLEQKALAIQQGKEPAALGRESARSRRLSALPPSLRPDRRLVNGIGGIRFTVQAPPGPGRLVRIPFYPLSAADSFSGAGGVDFPGDDPVVSIRIPGGARVSRPIQLRTEQFDYGKYRILGFQTNELGVIRPGLAFTVPGGDIGPVVVTFSDLSLYNGQTLFLQQEQVWSASFNVYPGSYVTSPTGGTGLRAERPQPYQRRRSRWFQGLRDYPVVTGTTDVTIIAQAYTRLPSPNAVGGPDYEYPITCNLIAEMVEDKVYGNVVNPSPAARPGAMVKVGARELGVNIEGREEIELVAARFQEDT